MMRALSLLIALVPESDEQGPADVSESEAPPDTDAVAVALEDEQCVEQQNVVQVAPDALHSQLQSEVEDADIIECGADADCELSEVFTDAGLWPMPMMDAARTEIVIRGSAVIQKSGPFATTVRASDSQRLHKVLNN